MRWGDDYQLLFTVPEEVKIPIEAARIGTVCEGPAGVWLDGRPPAEDEVLGYRH
jgi:thiamine-monophosphate kinase